MSDNQAGKPSIGDQIPYRRDQIEKKTGSLVFDQHLNEKLGDGSVQLDKGMAKADNPLKPDQVT